MNLTWSRKNKVDRICEDSTFRNYNVTNVNGKPRYVKIDTSGGKDNQTRLNGYAGTNFIYFCLVCA